MTSDDRIEFPACPTSDAYPFRNVMVHNPACMSARGIILDAVGGKGEEAKLASADAHSTLQPLVIRTHLLVLWVLAADDIEVPFPADRLASIAKELYGRADLHPAFLPLHHWQW